MTDTQEAAKEALEEFKNTLRSVVKGGDRITATERLRAGLALAVLDDGIPSTKAGYLRHVINGTG